MAEPRRLPILVTDDDPDIRESLRLILETEGYRVITANNGREALAVMERDPPAVVLLDMRMPVLDGWGFARAVGQGSARPPILVMTAARNASGWAEEIGADDYVAKPFGLDEFLDKVERLCAGRTERRGA